KGNTTTENPPAFVFPQSSKNLHQSEKLHCIVRIAIWQRKAACRARRSRMAAMPAAFGADPRFPAGKNRSFICASLVL
ncbi:MAG: hypothetical protein ACFN4G_08545, partial [Mitsuokella sp.]